MTTSFVNAESVLAVDIGTVSTRAMLFDLVEGQFTFVAACSAPTTIAAPYRDLTAGVAQAIRGLQEVTGQALLGADSQVILPSQSDGSGIDRLVVTFSAGSELKIAIAGLLADVSLESARRLAESTYSRVVESFGLNDRRRLEAQVDAILKADPDLILISGGTEGGASRSLGRQVDLVQLMCRLLPRERRPEVIFAGNQALAGRIKEILEKWTAVQVVPNLRPSIDQEDLAPAQVALNQTAARLRQRQMPGLAALSGLCATPPMPTAWAFSRIIRFLGRVYDTSRGVMGVDLGASNTVIAAVSNGQLSTSVAPYGMGEGARAVLQSSRLEDFVQWLPLHIPEDVVRDTLWQKTLNPASLPATAETLAIEQALARQALRLAIAHFNARYPNAGRAFEPVLVSGATISQAASPVQSLLILLDGIQPGGVTTFLLDQNGITSALGAIADFSTELPIQVLESGAYLNLGKVICPIHRARYGTPVLQVRLEYEKGGETKLEVRSGTLVGLPLQPGQVARIHLQALRGTVIDPNIQRSSFSFRLVGGTCGAVIDARGRPLAIPSDAARRRDLLRKWAQALGG